MESPLYRRVMRQPMARTGRSRVTCRVTETWKAGMSAHVIGGSRPPMVSLEVDLEYDDDVGSLNTSLEQLPELDEDPPPHLLCSAVPALVTNSDEGEEVFGPPAPQPPSRFFNGRSSYDRSSSCSEAVTTGSSSMVATTSASTTSDSTLVGNRAVSLEKIESDDSGSASGSLLGVDSNKSFTLHRKPKVHLHSGSELTHTISEQCLPDPSMRSLNRQTGVTTLFRSGHNLSERQSQLLATAASASPPSVVKPVPEKLDFTRSDIQKFEGAWAESLLVHVIEVLFSADDLRRRRLGAVVSKRKGELQKE
ncbi:unnamed protein product [Cyprideis torosa]|uniref:Uncharacterized protein n=1 Tax=Cyprideis torosa TaxID=163714 RepID=A0A7R8ZSE5_9CRUS|nr:unnamed protein product [Cyprideis torosa]CAG0895362.1 unnamed protein product [Cyprideis torosa]